MSITIYHNPACSKSRSVLAMIRASGQEPRVVEYLKTPPSRAELVDLLARMGMTPRALMRQKDKLFAELGLGDTALGDDALLDAMQAHPGLMERPVVVAPRGVKLCRPPEEVLPLLAAP